MAGVRGLVPAGLTPDDTVHPVQIGGREDSTGKARNLNVDSAGRTRVVQYNLDGTTAELDVLDLLHFAVIDLRVIRRLLEVVTGQSIDEDDALEAD